MNIKKIRNGLLEIFADLLITSQKETKRIKQEIKSLTNNCKL